ncbi:alpha/beta-hydrolase, partial [Auriculariales sp. MPI-PUGE-AT-0066]
MNSSETAPLLPSRPRDKHHSKRWVWWTVAGLAAALVLGSIILNPFARSEPPKSDEDAPFNWLNLEPSTDFNWVKCFDEYECARLEVPLDWAKPKGDKAAIAVLRLPSKYSANDTQYRGPIIYNPGGPGGSGNDFVRKIGPFMRDLVGSEYDHVGFDPRGVGFTTPVLNMFPAETERRVWEAAETVSNNATGDGLGRAYARARVFSDLAARRIGETAQYLGTAARTGSEKLKYWGGSYGSILGASLATMFPDRIERLVIDSVMETQEYFDTIWLKNVLSSDDALEWLFISCAASSACPLYEPSAAAVKQRYLRIVDAIHEQPLAVLADDSPDRYGLVDYSMVRKVIFTSLNSPYRLFPRLSQALRDMEVGDGRAMYALSGRDDSEWRCKCSSDGALIGSIEATRAILCGDGAVVNDTISELREHMQRVHDLTTFADMMYVRVWCSSWRVRTVERVQGPYAANTSHPILIMNNMYDPVTPLDSARAVSANFPGSAVVEVATAGHGAIITPSLCMARHLRAYFRDGVLPINGTICAVDKPIFESSEGTNRRLEAFKAMSVEDRRLWAATDQLSQTVSLSGMWL